MLWKTRIGSTFTAAYGNVFQELQLRNRKNDGESVLLDQLGKQEGFANIKRFAQSNSNVVRIVENSTATNQSAVSLQ